MIEYVEIRNTDRELVGVVDDAESIIWMSEYYGTGRFEIYVHVTSQTIAMLQVGNYVTRPNDVNVGIIENLHITWTPQSGRMIVASGRFAKSILDRRLIYKYKNYRITPIVSKGLVEVAARNLVSANIIATGDTKRDVPFIALGEFHDIRRGIVNEDSENNSIQTSYAGLLEYTDTLLQEYSLGAYMYLDRNSKQLLYTVFEGKRRNHDNTDGNAPIIFSQDFDNLLSSDYKYQTTALKTTALIGGEGEGTEQFCTTIGHYAAGLSRREVFVDAKSQSKKYKEEATDTIGNIVEVEKTYTDAEYAALLKAHGQQAIAQLQIVQTFNGNVDVTNSDKVFGVDYWIGDIVTIHDVHLSAYMETRILTATEVQDQNGYKLVITFGA